MSEHDDFADLFGPEPVVAAPTQVAAPWKVLVVDDEADIHAVLRLALQNVLVEGRPLRFLDAMSAAEAYTRLSEHPDIALVLLDVVLETEHAGLEVVGHIRQNLGNRLVQIVLVTGQPGYAPQREVVTNYAINGYRLKSELTADKIFITLYTALRTYQALSDLEHYHHHLEDIVQSRTAELLQARDDAQNANRAKTVFLGTMSHELLTPMNGIMGMTELVLRRATDPTQIDWLRKSQAAANQLLSLINNLLRFSQIESEQLTLEEQEFSIAQVLHDTLNLQATLAQANGLSLSWDIEPALPDRLCGDASRLREILTILVGNAVKFSEHGHVKVRITAEESDSQSIYLRFAVIDQGVGVSPEQQAGLFKVLTTADDALSGPVGGSGLGLAIAKRLARKMGGDVGGISEAEQGSTIWATARFKRATDAPQSATQPARDEERVSQLAPFHGARVLVVEAEPVNREILLFLLDYDGLAPESASNGQEAVDKVRTGNYELILMSVQMPQMDGLEATRAIRELPGKSDIPILGLTADAFDEDCDACLAAGMNAHVGKLAEPETLCATVAYWLQKSRNLTGGPP